MFEGANFFRDTRIIILQHQDNDADANPRDEYWLLTGDRRAGMVSRAGRLPPFEMEYCGEEDTARRIRVDRDHC